MSAKPPPIYLDAHSTTAVDPEVLRAMVSVYENHCGNPSSTTHQFGWYAAELVQIAREETADLIGAKPEEIFFTSGATESNNLVIAGRLRSIAARASTRPSPKPSSKLASKLPHILFAATEHSSVREPIAGCLDRGSDCGCGVEVTELAVDSCGRVSLEQIRQAIQANTALVCVMLANNEIGTVQPLSEIAAVVSQARAELGNPLGAALLCDATQAPGRMPVDVKSLGVDYLTLSAHKMYGPKGVGALYARSGAPAIEPLFFGGGQEQGLRPGTHNVAGIVGLGVAARLAKARCVADAEKMRQLAAKLLGNLRDRCPDIRLIGPELSAGPEPRLAGNLNIFVPGLDSVKLLAAVGSKLAISSASACQSQSGKSSHVLKAIGLDDQEQRGCLRIGISRTTTEDEIDRAAEILLSAIRR